MSLPEELVRDRLSADPLIPARVAGRIYPLIRPQDSLLPAITYQRISSDRGPSLGGHESALTNIRLQVDCWASSYPVVKALAEEVFAALTVASGALRALLLSDNDLYEEQPRIYRASMDFSVWV